jgi:hypothetical protein
MGTIGTTGRPELDPVAPLLQAYRRVLNDITRRLRAGELLPDSYLARQVGPILRALKSLDADSARWAEKMVRETYPKGLVQASAELRAIGVIDPAVTGSFGDFDRRAAQALISRTSVNLAAIRETLVEGLLGGERPNTATAVRNMRAALEADNALVEVAGRGLKVATPSGRKWDPEKYARMLGRTATSDARRVAQRARYLQNGVDVVVVSSTGSNHDVCIAWEGRQLSLTGATKGIPTVADARAAGLWHPNCTHRYYADGSAEQPGGDLTRPDDPNYSTLGQFQPEDPEVAARIVREGEALARQLAEERGIGAFAGFRLYKPIGRKVKAQEYAAQYHTSFRGGKPMLLREWNAVNKELTKLPPKAQAALQARGRGLELVKNGGITAHPDFEHLKTVHPRGYPKGKTYADVTGAAGVGSDQPIVIVVNKMGEGGSKNVILHEMAHGVDSGTAPASAAKSLQHVYSNSKEWKEIHKTELWATAYEAKYPEEAFAESFAKFYDSPESRASLPQSVFEYIKAIFED